MSVTDTSTVMKWGDICVHC